MYCKKCGKEIPDDSIYCNHCGTRQIPQKVSIKFNKPNIKEADVRNGILSFFAYIKKAIKWLWKVLWLKLWLWGIVFIMISTLIVYVLTIDYGDNITESYFIVVYCLIPFLILCWYVYQLYKWLYKKDKNEDSNEHLYPQSPKIEVELDRTLEREDIDK